MILDVFNAVLHQCFTIRVSLHQIRVLHAFSDMNSTIVGKFDPAPCFSDMSSTIVGK